jgi:hypothetical protein
MEKDLNTSATTGVVAEFCDAFGNLVAQEVFFDWQKAPLPAVGDLLTCASPAVPRDRQQVVVGRVCRRYFDVQRDDEGLPCVWVRLILQVCSARPPRVARRQRGWYSLN